MECPGKENQTNLNMVHHECPDSLVYTTVLEFGKITVHVVNVLIRSTTKWMLLHDFLMLHSDLNLLDHKMSEELVQN